MGEVDKHRLLQGILRLDAEIANVLSSWRPEARQREIREDFVRRTPLAVPLAKNYFSVYFRAHSTPSQVSIFVGTILIR